MKEMTPKDTVILEAIKLSVKRANESPVTNDLYDVLTNRTHTIRSLGELAIPAGHDAIDLCKRYLELRKIAYHQASRIIHAARLYLEGVQLSKDEIATALSDTKAIGRIFGRIGGNTNEGRGESADDYIMNFVISSPSVSFEYAKETGVKFSNGVIQGARGFMDASNGCPAMGVILDQDGNQETLYDYFWDRFSTQYVDDFKNDKPFQYSIVTDNDY